MMSEPIEKMSGDPAILAQAYQALRAGNLDEARRIALTAALNNPDNEAPWLLLGAVTPPRESVTYIQKALAINPHSSRARNAMHWAVQRLSSTPSTFQQEVLPVERPAPRANRLVSFFDFILKRGLTALAILLGIILLTQLGLFLASMGQRGLPVNLITTLTELFHQSFDYIFHHPATYIWHKEEISAFTLVAQLFLNSAGLLLISQAFAVLLGGLLGILATVWRKRGLAPVFLLVSIPGISIPSFLLAMLFWVINIQVMQLLKLDKALLPPTGFGWDLHLILPALTLAVRPLAQIMQVTYINLSEVLDKDYVTAARGRGLSKGLALVRHAIPNILIPVLTTLGTSLRLSLASLPVVESFFLWPGIGLTILQMISSNMPTLITDLIVALGILFITINLGLDLLYLLIDPRLRKGGKSSEWIDEQEWASQSASTHEALHDWLVETLKSLRGPIRRITGFFKPSLKAGLDNQDSAAEMDADPFERTALPGSGQPAANFANDLPLPSNTGVSDTRVIFRALATNFPLIIGTILVVSFLMLAIFGDRIVQVSPYLTKNIAEIGGKVFAPPFPPSVEYPWGSDVVGRDIQALVLAGAQRTFALALFATLARVTLGTLLGMITGWWYNSWFDRLIGSLISVWSAFPVTLFAMIIILALGIQKGMSVFIIALCLVGWGEITQYVRGVVIAQKPMQYVEAAWATGARMGRILRWHILPHLIPSILVLSILEMGGVLMLLAELGFLNIFLGGGFSAIVAETGRMQPVFYFFSDVPEWGALLANIRNWWRSYPWMAWYPGIFFFMAILAFNLWSEGMRRFIEESRINLNRLINRYTVIAATVILAGSILAFRSATPIQAYSRQARQFDAQRAMQDIAALTAPEFQGRESGLTGSKLAAEYIGKQMEEIGLLPAGQNNTFFRNQDVILSHLTATPSLELVNNQGSPLVAFIYHQDFTECTEAGSNQGDAEGLVVGVSIGANTAALTGKPLTIQGDDLFDKILMIQINNIDKIKVGNAAGLLVISEDHNFLQRHDLFLKDSAVFYTSINMPILEITPEAADMILKIGGTSLTQFDQVASGLKPDTFALTPTIVKARASVQVSEPTDTIQDVIGFIPGQAGTRNPITGQQLDSQVILISAYYDGVGTSPDGTLYPGANDNASGVATLLEIARVLKQAEFKPNKTIVFAAWGEGERGRIFSVKNTMAAKTGFDQLNVEAVIELSGTGAGQGKGIALGQGSSFRLISLFQEAAQKIGVPVTTRGRSPHFGSVAVPSLSERSAISAFTSWDGSDWLVHTPQDTLQIIDPEKLRKLGQTTTLVITVLSRETKY